MRMSLNIPYEKCNFVNFSGKITNKFIVSSMVTIYNVCKLIILPYLP